MATTHATLPNTRPVRKTNEVALETLVEMECRVVGGTMSTKAAIRSTRDSSAKSDETEDIDNEDDVLDEEEEA